MTEKTMARMNNFSGSDAVYVKDYVPDYTVSNPERPETI
jgi:hypothetical protein